MSTKKRTKLKAYHTADGQCIVLSKEEMLELDRPEGDSSKTIEDHAHFNAQLWMANCHGLTMEILRAIGKSKNIPALIQEVGDYQGPTELLRDTARWLAGRKKWRKAFRPVLDAAGWQG